MKQRPPSSLTALQAGISNVLGEKKLEMLAAVARLRRAWPTMIGPVLAQHTEPLNVESDTLLIAIDHPAMAQQIRFLQREIRDACFHKCRIGNIKRIRTCMRPGAGIDISGKTGKPGRAIRWNEKRNAVRILRHVTDKTLRRAMFDAYLAQLAYKMKETA